MYQHLILTQKLIIFDRLGLRKDDHPSALREFMKVYADVLPREDSTQMIFWPKEVLTEVDSQLLIQ